MADLDFKVYNAKGEYIAACKHPEDAAAIVAAYGTVKTTVKYNGRIVWDSIKDPEAIDSYDKAAQIMLQRLQGHRREHIEKMARMTTREISG